MTRLQRRNLQLWLRFRDRPMTIAGLAWFNRRFYGFLLLYFGTIALGVGFYFGLAAAAYPALAVAVALLRDLGFYRGSASLWPITKQVLDWKRIEELVTSNEPSAHGASKQSSDPDPSAV